MNERAIFDAALEIHDQAKRLSFLEKICAGDAELRTRIDQLLSTHEGIGSFLDIPAVEQLQPDANNARKHEAEFPPAAPCEEGTDEDELRNIVLSLLTPSLKPDSLGKLGHYEIVQILGQGGFGVVLKAFDEKLHRNVAIKVMNPQMAATSPPRKRFLREARVSAAIRHENIVQVYSVEEHPLPYLVMEFISGQNLQQKLDATGPLTAPEVLHLGRQIAAGLTAAHAGGLIHRDIKPGNILIEDGAEQKVKITDFGLARAADDASVTRSGMVSGTPMYMAPEQALGQTLDHRADLFSLGSVLYQMACGRPPFRAASTVAVLRRVAEDTPRPLQEILPAIPDWLVAIVAKLHAKEPEERFQTAREVADLLAQCQAELQNGGVVTAASGLLPLPSEQKSPEISLPLREQRGQPVGAGIPAVRRFQLVAFGFLCTFLPGLLLMEVTGLTHLTLIGRQHNSVLHANAGANSAAETRSAASAGQSKRLSGMIGRGYANGEDVSMFFTYHPGYKLTREEIQELQNCLTRNGRLEFQGILSLSEDAEVAFHHIGGSSNRGVHYLFVDDNEVHSVGDDRVKDDTLTMKLGQGEHLLRWILTGGELGDAQLEVNLAHSGNPPVKLEVYASEEMVAAARAGIARQEFEFGKQ